jgi:hypothetical protein
MCHTNLWKYCRSDEDAELLMQYSARITTPELNFLRNLSESFQDRVVQMMPPATQYVSLKTIGDPVMIAVVCKYFRACSAKLGPERATDLFKLHSGEQLLKGLCITAIWQDNYLFEHVESTFAKLYSAGFSFSSVRLRPLPLRRPDR